MQLDHGRSRFLFSFQITIKGMTTDEQIAIEWDTVDPFLFDVLDEHPTYPDESVIAHSRLVLSLSTFGLYS